MIGVTPAGEGGHACWRQQDRVAEVVPCWLVGRDGPSRGRGQLRRGRILNVSYVTKTVTVNGQLRRGRLGQPDRGRPGWRGFIETAQFPSRCEIETGYYPIETDLNGRSESNHRDGSLKSSEACVREW